MQLISIFYITINTQDYQILQASMSVFADIHDIITISVVIAKRHSALLNVEWKIPKLHITSHGNEYREFLPDESFRVHLSQINSIIKIFNIYFPCAGYIINKKWRWQPDFVSFHGVYAVSYTHLTLPTNREV